MRAKISKPFAFRSQASSKIEYTHETDEDDEVIRVSHQKNTKYFLKDYFDPKYEVAGMDIPWEAIEASHSKDLIGQFKTYL